MQIPGVSRRVVSLSVSILILLVSGVATGAGAKGVNERTVTRMYNVPFVGAALQPPTSACVDMDDTGCFSEQPQPGERFVTISVADAAGGQVAGLIEQDAHKDSGPSMSQSFCGSTPDPVAINPRKPVDVFIFAVGSADCPGATVSGSATLTFIRKVPKHAEHEPPHH